MYLDPDGTPEPIICITKLIYLCFLPKIRKQ